MVKLKNGLNALVERLMLLLGLYDRYTRLPENFRPGRVIFVCKGNVCRSVYAEFYLRKLLQEQSEAGAVQVLSCGLETDGDTPANITGMRVARQRGLDLAAHTSVKAQTLQFIDRDLVVVMEPYMIKWLDRLSPRQRGAPILLLGLLSKPRQPSIPDPYGASEATFHQVFATIESKISVVQSRCL